MKLVEFKGRADGLERPGVEVDGTEYRLGKPVVVSENVAKKLGHLKSHKFEISDAPEGHVPAEEESPHLGESAGFGGSPGSVEVEPDQES